MLIVKVKEGCNMMNFLKKVKNLFSINPTDEAKSPVTPGTDTPKEDVGKKVFERTGKLREGIGQSSTVVETDYNTTEENNTSKKPQAEERLKQQTQPAKHHGIRKRKNVVETSSFNTSPISKDKSATTSSNNKKSPSRRKPRFKQKTK
jgi:FtsZ-interacting cell division protein YlmF